MRERHVALCRLNKRYKDPTPRPRYPTQRLAACNLVMMECLRMFWVSFLYSMSENLLERGWRTYNLGNGRSGTGTSKNSHNGSHPCLTLNYHKITWLEPISRYRKYTPRAISPSVRSPLSIDYVNYDSPSSACPENTAPSHYSTVLPSLQQSWDPWATWKIHTTFSSLFQCWCPAHFYTTSHRYPVRLGELWHEDRAPWALGRNGTTGYRT